MLSKVDRTIAPTKEEGRTPRIDEDSQTDDSKLFTMDNTETLKLSSDPSIESNADENFESGSLKEQPQAKSSIRKFGRQNSDSSESVSAPKKINALQMFDTVLPDSEDIESIIKEKNSTSSKTDSDYLWSLMMRESSSESENEIETKNELAIVYRKKTKSNSDFRFDLTKGRNIDTLPSRLSTRLSQIPARFSSYTFKQYDKRPYFLKDLEPGISSEIIKENYNRLRKITNNRLTNNEGQLLNKKRTKSFRHKSRLRKRDCKSNYSEEDRRKASLSKLTTNKTQSDNLEMTVTGKRNKRLTRRNATTEQEQTKKELDSITTTTTLTLSQGKDRKESNDNLARKTKHDKKYTRYPGDTKSKKTPRLLINKKVINRNRRSTRNQQKVNHDKSEKSLDINKNMKEKKEDDRQSNRNNKKEFTQTLNAKENKNTEMSLNKKRAKKKTSTPKHNVSYVSCRLQRRAARVQRTRPAAIASGLASCLRG